MKEALEGWRTLFSASTFASASKPEEDLAQTSGASAQLLPSLRQCWRTHLNLVARLVAKLALRCTIDLIMGHVTILRNALRQRYGEAGRARSLLLSPPLVLGVTRSAGSSSSGERRATLRFRKLQVFAGRGTAITTYHTFTT